MTSTERMERILQLALLRGDRVAAINAAQRAYGAGDVDRTAVIAMVAGANMAEPAAAIAERIAGHAAYQYATAEPVAPVQSPYVDRAQLRPQYHAIIAATADNVR